MTISSQNRQAGPFVGNDTATAFPFAFKLFTASDLQVVRTNSAGVESTLVLDTDYTASINSNQDSNPGGTVTLAAGALASNTKLTITSSIQPLQSTDLTNQGGFYPKVITNALDKLTILIQQALNGLGRSIKVPVSDGSGDIVLPTATQRANTQLLFDANGNPYVAAPASGSAADVLLQLASTAVGKGASLSGVQDAGNYYAGSTVEAVTQEIGAHLRTQKPAAHSLPRLFRTLQGYRHDLQVAINIVGFGSSVGAGATLASPAVDAPVAHFFIKLKAALDPGALYNFQVFNDSVNGSALSQVSAALSAAVSAGHAPKVCLLAYGMNDAQVALYNSGQTFPSIYTYIMQHVKEARALGADVILMTTPHHKTASGASLYTMPNGVPQTYPTAVAANVAPEALLPPASASNTTADFLGTGTSIVASHRHLRVNQAIRQAATDAGVPLIDVEPYWFKAVATYGEAALFNSGETVHPNLLGHQQSYHKAIDEFIEAIARQTAQGGQEARLYGLTGVNVDLPTSTLDVRPPTGDGTTPPMTVHARIGKTDGAGVKATSPAWRIDPTNGDMVCFVATTNTSTPTELEFFRWHAQLDGTGTIVDHITETRTTNGMTAVRYFDGTFNLAAGQQSPTNALPNNCAGTIWVQGYNSGIGRQHVRVEFIVKSGVITFGAVESVGDAVFTGPTASGAFPQVNVASAATNLAWEIRYRTDV